MGHQACSYRSVGRRSICEVDGQAWLEAAHTLTGGGSGYTYFVDPSHPDRSLQNDGRNMDYPLPTVASALAKCRAYRNDQVLVGMNAYWTYANPASARYVPISENVIVTVPGVRILGLSPTSSIGVPWTASDDDQTLITVRAMDVTIEGFAFWNGGNTGCIAVAAAWDAPPYGENCTVRDCYFYSVAYGITLDWTYNCIIENCRFQSITTQAIHNPSVYGEPDYLTIRDCDFVACMGGINLPDCHYEVIEHCTFSDCTAAIVVTAGDDNVIRGCAINGAPGGTNNFINLTGGATNLVADCQFSCSKAQYDTTCSDGTSGSWVNNWCSDGSPVAAPT